jgi:hypothetical protein
MMAESESEFWRRLFGYFKERLGEEAANKTVDDGIAAVTEKLRRGGDEGVRVFCSLADDVLRREGKKALLEWVWAGFWVLPKGDQEDLIGAMLDNLIQRGLLKNMVGYGEE